MGQIEASAPMLSIGMPVKNCARTIGPALRSILLQDFRDWELLLIDDGSSDDTLKVAGDLADSRVRILSDGLGLGLPDRLNQALYLARGRLFGRMDGDDVAYPSRMGRQVRYLQEHPEVDLVGARVAVFGAGGKLLGVRRAPEGHEAICRKSIAGFPMAHPTFLGRLDWFRRYGYRREAVRCEDQDLLHRAHANSRFANVPEVLLGYREERLELSKILKGRRHFAAQVSRRCRETGHPFTAMRATAEQVLKGAVDCVAVSSGLGYRLLRHRAGHATSEERSSWEEVWRSVGGAG